MINTTYILIFLQLDYTGPEPVMFSSYLTHSLVCPAAAGYQDQDDSHPLPRLHVCHPRPPGGVSGTEGSGGGARDVDGEIHLTPG